MLVWKMYFFFQDTPCAGDRHRTTNNREADCSFPKRVRTFGVSLFLALCCSTLIEIWQRFGSLKISWDLAVLDKVMRNRGMFMVVVTSLGDWRVAVICLTLITSKPRLTNPSDMSSSGVLRGKCVTAVRVRVRVRVTLQLTVSQSVRLGVEPLLGLMTRYLFPHESCCPICMGRPL
jgi:hypothetical protein